MFTFPNEPWRAYAACAGMDTNLFFSDRGATDQAKDAVAICNTCTVRPECLEYALVNGEIHGVWGGITPKKRRRMRRLGGYLTPIQRTHGTDARWDYCQCCACTSAKGVGA